jgi:hypothetical protein
MAGLSLRPSTPYSYNEAPKACQLMKPVSADNHLQSYSGLLFDDHVKWKDPGKTGCEGRGNSGKVLL